MTGTRLEDEDHQSIELEENIDLGSKAVGEEDTTTHYDEFSPTLKKILTLIYYGLLLSTGMAASSVGTTLVALAFNTGTTEESAGFAFTSRGIGYLCGSTVAGKALEKFNVHYAMLFSNLLGAVIYFFLPFIKSLPLVLGGLFIQAFFMSWVEIGTSVVVMRIWKKDAAPWLQGLHFTFGLGATISPMIIGIFIKAFEQKQAALWGLYPVCAMQFLTAVPLLIFKSPKIEEETKEGEETTAQTGKQAWFYNGLIALLGVYLLLYVGSESSYGGWIFYYAIKVYEYPDDKAAFLASAFWLSFTVGRALSVPLSMKVSAKNLLLGDKVGCFASISVLIAFTYLKSEALLWTMSILLGLSMASVYASTLVLLPEMGVKITTKATSLLVVGGALGDMVTPTFVGFLMNKFGASSLLYIEFILFAASFVIFGIVMYFMAPKVKFHLSKEYQIVEEVLN
eukprot:TRINITY_DN8563_c0_g1_i1.p1 TRINITY_DN8563_c0_g1~~TRINITY_DN8563_c0_g1_i1.p1  ORF type:complete len:453 (-),score=118.60 TRINITY_DN8563_c0_g1_i1:48-1406(-)